MDNEIQNTGSFGAAIGPGAGDAVASAMARRGMQGGGQLNQNTQNPQAMPPVSPTGSPSLPPTSTPQAGTAAPMGAAPPSDMETQMILRSLDTKLKSISKIQETQAGVR